MSTYHLFEDLPSLVLPIFCKWIPCLAFSFLLRRSTPCNFNISKFKVWVQGYEGYESFTKQSLEFEERHTKSDDIGRLFIKP
jgi:hypothetical protein